MKIWFSRRSTLGLDLATSVNNKNNYLVDDPIGGQVRSPNEINFGIPFLINFKNKLINSKGRKPLKTNI